MKEIVAEKIRGIQWLYLVLAIVCAGLLVYFLGFYSGNSFAKFLMTAILIASIIICIIAFIFAIRTPKIIATYDDSGNLIFPEFTCRPRDIEDVEYKFARNSKLQGTAPDHGTLYITYKGKKYSYYYVRELNKASTRLTELVTADKTIQQFEEEGQANG